MRVLDLMISRRVLLWERGELMYRLTSLQVGRITIKKNASQLQFWADFGVTLKNPTPPLVEHMHGDPLFAAIGLRRWPIFSVFPRFLR